MFSIDKVIYKEIYQQQKLNVIQLLLQNVVKLNQEAKYIQNTTIFRQNITK